MIILNIFHLIKRVYYYKVAIYFIFFLIKTSISFILNSCSEFEITKLDNNNILVFACNRLFIIDPTFTTIINQTYFCCLNLCNSYNKFVHFSKEEGGYILLINDDEFLIFSKEGNILSERSSFPYSSLSIIPYVHEGKNLSFYNIYAKDNNTIYFNKYSYNLLTNGVGLEENYNKNINYAYNNIITCQLMENLNKSVIACFFQINNFWLFDNINLIFFQLLKA